MVSWHQGRAKCIFQVVILADEHFHCRMYEYFPVCAELVQSFCGSYGGGRYSDGRIALIQERPAATSALPSVCLHAGKDKAFSRFIYGR